MQKLVIILMLSLLLVSSVLGGIELTTVWEKSAAQSAMPAWFDTGNLTRGLSYGMVGQNERLFVVSRNGGNYIYYLDAATGDSLGHLDATGISGGTYHLSDVGLSEDGKIYVCNLAIGSTFKVYAYDSEIDTATTVIAHAHSGRLGDKLKVMGSSADNSLKIYAASGNSNEVLVFSTTDNGASFIADTVSITNTGGSASVGPLANGDFYWNAAGKGVVKYAANGSEIGTISTGVVPSGSNAIRSLTATGDYEYFVTFQYGSGNENARVVRAHTSDVSMAETYSLTPSLGTNSNVGGTGDVAVKDNGDGSYTVFVLSTNNGLGSYKIEFPVPAETPVNMTLDGTGYAGDYGWFQVDNNLRGMAFNGKTDHTLMASRSGGAYIHVLDAGVVVDTLDMTGVTGGTYALNKVVCDTAGVIYACNLALANGNFKMYRWENEQAVPTLAFEGTVAQRAGDAMAVSGSGVGTVLYASGSGANQIEAFTSADGISFTQFRQIPITAGTARGGISAVTNGTGSDLWINGSGTTVQKIDSAGTVVSEIPGGVIASSWMNVLYMQADNGVKFLAVNGNNVNGDKRKLQVWDITDSETSPSLWATGEMWNIEQANANAAGELAFYNRGNEISLFQLVTNNGVASWSLQLPEKVDLETIAEVKIDENQDLQPDRLGEVVRIRGIVTSPNYGFHSQYYLQDATAGMTLYSNSLDFELNAGDEIEITGEISYYRGITQIEPAEQASLEVLSTGNDVMPMTVKIPEVGEATEQMLVKLDSVWITDLSQWPEEGSNGYSSDIKITDGVDTVGIFVDKETELPGWTPPIGLMNVIAVSDQYTSSSNVHDDGYSLRGTFQYHFIDLSPKVSVEPDTLEFGEVAINGRKTMDLKFKNMGDSPITIDSLTFGTMYYASSLADTIVAGMDSIMIPVTFMPIMTDPVEDVVTIHTPVANFDANLSGAGFVLWPLEWRIHADSSTSDWFYISGAMEHMVRGMAYNKMKNHLYVVSRVRGSFVYVLDAATGDTLKKMNTDKINGGTYHINLIAATEDGQIVVGNLAAWGGQQFKLYHYKNEDDTATVIYDGSYDDFGGRVGDALAVTGSGDNIKVFFTGSNNPKVHILETTDGLTFTRGTDIDLPEAGASYLGVAPVDNGDYIFTNGAGKSPRYIKGDGTVLYEFDTSVLNSGTSINYFEVRVPGNMVRRFVGITSAWTSGTSVVELLGEPGDNLCSSVQVMDAPTEDYATNSNANATGVAVYNSVNNSLVELITNNGISSYSMDVIIPDAIKDQVVLTELNEGFESTALGAIPSGWLTFADSVQEGTANPAWSVSEYNPHEGSKNAYMPNYNTKSNCWLVTPALSLKGSKKFLTFYLKDDWNDSANDLGSEIQILVSTKSQNDPKDFEHVATYSESDFYDAWMMKSVDLNAYSGDFAYVAFMVKNFGDPNDTDAGGDNWHLDDVMLADSLTSIADMKNNLPVEFALGQNYPNPFNPATRFELSLPKTEDVTVEIYNMLGQRVVTLHSGRLEAGIHKFQFKAQQYASGVYFYRVQAGSFNSVKKMMLLK